MWINTYKVLVHHTNTYVNINSMYDKQDLLELVKEYTLSEYSSVCINQEDEQEGVYFSQTQDSIEVYQKIKVYDTGYYNSYIDLYVYKILTVYKTPTKTKLLKDFYPYFTKDKVDNLFKQFSIKPYLEPEFLLFKIALYYKLSSHILEELISRNLCLCTDQAQELINIVLTCYKDKDAENKIKNIQNLVMENYRIFLDTKQISKN